MIKYALIEVNHRRRISIAEALKMTGYFDEIMVGVSKDFDYNIIARTNRLTHLSLDIIYDKILEIPGVKNAKCILAEG